SKSDGTSNGDITIVRDHSGGAVTVFEQNVNGKQVSLLKDGTALPGLTTNGDDLHSCPPGVTMDSNGKIATYWTRAGVQVNLDASGNASAYHSNGFSFEHHQDGWYYHQDSGGDYVKIGTPTVDSNGTIQSKEDGGFNHDREHTLDGGGQQTSGTIFSGTLRNLGHDVIDDTVSMVPNTIGQITGNNTLASWGPQWIDPVDPSHASDAERVGGGIGSALSLINPIGDEERAASILEKVVQHGSSAAKNGANRTRGNASKDNDLNPLHDWNWYNWLTN
ncbi:MAG: hypothetical protein K2X81_24510, partial [Candidatus Obscuribacterales bacterium]|nr:hypothetical protein [Candidatus Obscuribacterales bacterium]